MRAWIVRESGPSDVDLIRDLYRVVRGAARPAAYDHWRYIASPLGPVPGALAMEGGRAVGFYTLWPTPLRVGATDVAGAQSMDTMTHPDFRGQGIFIALARACYEIASARGIRLLYGFPNSESYPGFVRRLDWIHAGDIQHWIRPIRPSRNPRLPTPLRWPADAIAALWPSGSRHGYDVATGLADPGRLTALVAEESAGGHCRVDRTSAWLAWRYGAKAAQGYEWIMASTQSQTRAVAVWGMQDEFWGGARDGRAHLVELSGADAGARAAALTETIARARARGAWLLETVTNAPEKINALRRAGFISHRAAPLIVRTLGDAAFTPSPLKGKHWRIMGGDLDTF